MIRLLPIPILADGANMAWDGKSIPEGKYRLRWVMKNQEGYVHSLSAWTPQDEGSFSKAVKYPGAIVSIEGECLQPYEHRVIISAPVEEVDSVEYLVLLVNGKHNHCGMGFVKGGKKEWALVSGDICKEGE